MRFRLGIGSKNKKKMTPSIEKKAMNGSDSPGGGLDSRSNSMNCDDKDEAFFDSQSQLDSDSDSFYSFNGGSSPNFQIITQLNKSTAVNTTPYTNGESSPTEGKRTLNELLQNQVEPPDGNASSRNEKTKANGYEERETTKVDTEKVPKYSNGTSNTFGVNSGSIAGGTPAEDLKQEKDEEEKKTKQCCCLPNLVHSLSFKKRRKQKMTSTK